eukprot:913003-Pleurochrysis_carterae.AAC.2
MCVQKRRLRCAARPPRAWSVARQRAQLLPRLRWVVVAARSFKRSRCSITSVSLSCASACAS